MSISNDSLQTDPPSLRTNHGDQTEDQVIPSRESDPLVGTIISDRYRLIGRVGEGGMGAVYRGEHINLRKPVAVKFLHHELSRVPDVVARFEREALAAAHLEHPNVVAAHDFGKTSDGTFFLVMEYVDGVNLSEAIEQAGRLDPGRVVTIARQMAAALARAHGMGIVHRDLKPDNVVLVEKDGVKDIVKVLDFGIAKMAGGTMATQGAPLTQAGMVFGTPEYMPPEQALGAQVDHRADLYAFGVMIFEMLSGQRPFNNPDVMSLLSQHLTAAVPSVTAMAGPEAALPVELDEVLRKMLAKSPNDRYQSAQDVADALSTTLGYVVQGGMDRMSATGQHQLIRADVSAGQRALPIDPRSSATPDPGPPTTLDPSTPPGTATDAPVATKRPSARELLDAAQTRTVTAMEGLDRFVERISDRLRTRTGTRTREWTLGVGGSLSLLAMVMFAVFSEPSSPTIPFMMKPSSRHHTRPPQQGTGVATVTTPRTNPATNPTTTPTNPTTHGPAIAVNPPQHTVPTPVVPSGNTDTPAVTPPQNGTQSETSPGSAEQLARDLGAYLSDPEVRAMIQQARSASGRHAVIPILESRLTKTPEEPFLHYVLGTLYAREKTRHADMVAAYERAINLRGDLVLDTQLTDDILREAVQTRRPATGALELLQNKLGVRVRDRILDIAMSTKVPTTRSKAIALLVDPPLGNPRDITLQSLLAFAQTPTDCQSRAPVIERIGQVADRRALPYLQSIPTRTQYCTGQNCATCIAPIVINAINAIQQREGITPGATPASQ